MFVCALMIALLQIVCRWNLWKNFDNRWIFGEDKSLLIQCHVSVFDSRCMMNVIMMMMCVKVTGENRVSSLLIRP